MWHEDVAVTTPADVVAAEAEAAEAEAEAAVTRDIVVAHSLRENDNDDFEVDWEATRVVRAEERGAPWRPAATADDASCCDTEKADMMTTVTFFSRPRVLCLCGGVA